MNEITTLEDWEALLESSSTTPCFVFKHSTTCPTSAHAHNQVNTYLAQRTETHPPFVLIKVIQSRPVSNAIAKTLGVTHQSPQLILVNKGIAVWDASHHWITEDSIADAVEALA